MHELAHIRRHDPWINLLQALLETVFFYHPAVVLGLPTNPARTRARLRRSGGLPMWKPESLRQSPRGHGGPTSQSASHSPSLQTVAPCSIGSGGWLDGPPRAPRCLLRWLAGVTALALLLTTVAFERQPAGSRQREHHFEPGRSRTAVLSRVADGSESISGRYKVDREGDHLWLELRREGSRGWRISSFSLTAADTKRPR